ncbi:MDR family MFS transporter [Nonomuraea wenchangensis]|uniref:Predicted arabinose efflux permease, MFS family n=1 Tax=Nonomuraea wenchangensis TaxID=568860 RepID=A0A1I0A0I3_9ACTN|nr:MFS transporter [Nonomuraea wenchangensis]SES87570.1 Predicted arabinose efflux permease, MFS family [Nonomuraea wenchangensis]
MSSTSVEKPPSFLRAQVGGLPRPFWALWGGTLVNRLGTMVMPFTGVYLTQSRGLSVTAAGLVMGVFGVGSLLSQPLAGMLTDRIGRRATLSGGMLATGAAMLALGYSVSLPAVLASMLVLGVVVDLYRPASNALVADLVGPAERPRAYGLLFWGINLGYSVGMTAGGWLAGLGFLWLFWIDAVSCVVFAVLVWRAVPETRPEGARQATGGFGAVLRDRVMVAFTLVVLGNALVYAQTMTMLPVAMTKAAGLSTAQYGTAMALNGVLIVVVQPLVSGWLGRRDPARTFALGLAVMGAGFALTAFVSSTLGLTATIAVWTAGEIVTAGIAGTIVAALAPPELRGRYAGLFGLAWSAAAVLAPLLGGPLLEMGPRALWFTIGAVGLVSAAGMLALGPAIRRRT